MEAEDWKTNLNKHNCFVVCYIYKKITIHTHEH